MDRRSMPALFLHFDLSSFFQPQVAADRRGSGAHRLELDVAILVEYLQPHPALSRFVVVVVEHRRLKSRTHIP